MQTFHGPGPLKPDSSERSRVLLSAYACEPGFGSEPGIGWNVACQLSETYDVWVLTRANNRGRIEAAFADTPRPGLRFIYYDLPAALLWAKRLPLGVQVYYLLWQWRSLSVARDYASAIGFQAVQHITFGRHWMPSSLPRLGLPFVWGPLGGGDSVPRAFLASLGPRGRFLNGVREAARYVGERLPLVRRCARQSCIALATTPETAIRLAKLGADDVRRVPAVGLSVADVEALGARPDPPGQPVRFISIGRLEHWKGFHYGLESLAVAGLHEAEYWVVGEGPERARLERLAAALGIGSQVRFLGQLSRDETLARLADAHALVHPSLHDSGGWVCLEAMAARRPVIYLNLGGPAQLVSPEAGIAIEATNPADAVKAMATAMSSLASSPELIRSLGEAGRRHVRECHTWPVRGATLRQTIADCLGVTKPGDARSRNDRSARGP